MFLFFPLFVFVFFHFFSLTLLTKVFIFVFFLPCCCLDYKDVFFFSFSKQSYMGEEMLVYGPINKEPDEKVFGPKDSGIRKL